MPDGSKPRKPKGGPVVVAAFVRMPAPETLVIGQLGAGFSVRDGGTRGLALRAVHRAGDSDPRATPKPQS